MNRPAAGPRPADRWLPVGWTGLAAVAAVLAAAVTGGLAGSALPVLLGTTLTRAGMDAAGTAAVGLTLIGGLLPLGAAGLSHGATRDAARVQAGADRALVLVAGGWLVLVLVGILFRAAAAYGTPLRTIDGPELVEFATRLAAGRGLLLTAGCTAVVLGCAIARLRDPDRVEVRIPLIAALLGVLTPAVTGHAGSAPDHEVAVVTVALHVGAAALWVGGLGALIVLLARHRPLLEAALPRFSRLAGVCLFLVAVTGVLNAALRVPGWEALLGTGYGGLVVAKTVAIVLLGALGGLARRRLAAGRTPVLRWAGLEVALMAATLGLAAALTQTGGF